MFNSKKYKTMKSILDYESNLLRKQTGFSADNDEYVEIGKTFDGKKIYIVNKEYIEGEKHTGLFLDVDS